MRSLTIAVKCVAAALLVALGTVLLVLPGPGVPLIFAGVGMLATEFEWAASLNARMVTLLQSVMRALTGAVSRLRPKPQRVSCTSSGCE